jgi:hypothetical protein
MPVVVDLAWTCPCCGKQYDKLSFAYASPEPDPWRAVPEEERSDRGIIWTDTCVIDQQQFFVRGRILIPVIGHNEPFIWGDFGRASRRQASRGMGSFGMSRSASTSRRCPAASPITSRSIRRHFGLKCKVAMKNARTRPIFEIESPDHPLAVEQRNGITLDRVKEFAALLEQHRS